MAPTFTRSGITIRQHFEMTAQLTFRGNMDKIEATGKVFAAVASAIAAGAGFFKWLFPIIERRAAERSNRSVADGVARLHTLHEALADVIREGAAHRCIVFAAHNCGGIPNPSTPFYTSPLHWSLAEKWHKGATEHILDYSALRVDGHYISLLLELIARGEIRYTTKTEKPSMLRDIYESAHVTDSIWIHLGIHGGKLFYASFSVYEGELYPEAITLIRLKANQIRNVLERSK